MKIKSLKPAVFIIKTVLRYCNKGRANLTYASRIIGCDDNELKNYPDHPIWERIGYYIAQLCVNIFLITSPEKLVIGGGLINNKHLLGHIRKNFTQLLNGYMRVNPEELIIRAKLPDKNGMLGASLLHN